MVRYVISIAVTLAFGMVLGFRVTTGHRRAPSVAHGTESLGGRIHVARRLVDPAEPDGNPGMNHAGERPNPRVSRAETGRQFGQRGFVVTLHDGQHRRGHHDHRMDRTARVPLSRSLAGHDRVGQGRAAQQPVGALGQLQEAPAHRRPHLVLLPRAGQLLQAVGSDRLQHPVARFRAVAAGPAVSARDRPGGRFGGEKRLVNQAGQRGQDVISGQRAPATDPFGKFKAPGKTASRRASTRSGSDSSSQLQSTTARRV